MTQHTPDDITELSASELARAIRRRIVSCTEVMRAYLDRINAFNPVYNAVVGMEDFDRLMESAREADQALSDGQYWGWLHGVPHAVKDLANARGLKTTAGSRIFANTVAQSDDLHIARIRAAGAIFIGKTNTPEFGLGSQTYNDVYGTTRNAYDPELTAGGSSGGAATGLATQMLPVADGSDMMGSLRNPAAFNNVIGFRPSQGRVPGVPARDTFYAQLATNGPMGRTVEDTIRLLHTMAGFDARAPLSLRDDLPPFEDHRNSRLEDYRVGWMADYGGYLATEPGLLDLCRRTLIDLSREGLHVEDCQPDYDMARLWETWLTLRHWAVQELRPLYDDQRTRHLLKPEVVWEIEGGIQMASSCVFQAGVARTDWYQALNNLFERFDLLALPSAQVFSFSADLHWPRLISGRAMDTYHRWMEAVIGGTLGGLPVVSLPAGFDSQGRPMGIQFLGPMGRDREVLEFALAYERVTDFLGTRPTLLKHPPDPKN